MTFKSLLVGGALTQLASAQMPMGGEDGQEITTIAQAMERYAQDKLISLQDEAEVLSAQDSD